MSDLYLVAHKVHSKPAFDIATRIECSACKQEDGDVPGCDECDGFGYWWVVPTSGHRAYPYWSHPLDDILVEDELGSTHLFMRPIPDNWPDHYTTRASPARQSLASLLAIPRPQLKVDRRF